MTRFFLSFFSLALLSQKASAHHVYGMEVSPAFEMFHGLVEPVLFALSGASLAVFLSRRTLGRFGATLLLGCAATILAFFLALASVLEQGAGLFLLWDALAGGLFFVLAQRWGARRDAKC